MQTTKLTKFAGILKYLFLLHVNLAKRIGPLWNTSSIFDAIVIFHTIKIKPTSQHPVRKREKSEKNKNSNHVFSSPLNSVFKSVFSHSSQYFGPDTTKFVKFFVQNFQQNKGARIMSGTKWVVIAAIACMFFHFKWKKYTERRQIAKNKICWPTPKNNPFSWYLAAFFVRGNKSHIFLRVHSFTLSHLEELVFLGFCFHIPHVHRSLPNTSHHFLII